MPSRGSWWVVRHVACYTEQRFTQWEEHLLLLGNASWLYNDDKSDVYREIKDDTDKPNAFSLFETQDISSFDR